MSLQSLNRVLGSFKDQYKHREQRQLSQVLACWHEVVGPIVAMQTRPLTLHRGVLKVATSSAAWAQNLVFERQRLIDKLNRILSSQLKDIRFSTAQWQEVQPTASFPGADQQAELWQAHPSRLTQGSPTSTNSQAAPIDPMAAFQNWKRVVRSRSQKLPLCPECHCPTPPGELDRWQVCSLCAAKRW